MSLILDNSSGLIEQAEYKASPNCDEREQHELPEVIIVHCISLPPGEYQGDAISDFFCNTLDCASHTYFEQIKDLHVSAHFLIRRDGQLIQYVPTHQRAWHAGESVCLGKPRVNDFSVGIELEGLDTDPEGFSDQQYRRLNQVVHCLRSAYPGIKPQNVFAHSDIAPGRKADPGTYFDWARVSLV